MSADRPARSAPLARAALTLMCLVAPLEARGAPTETSTATATSPELGAEPDPSLDTRGLVARLEAEGRRFAEAKRLLARGRAAEALDRLGANTSALLADREHLLRGDALLALGRRDAALAAYKRAAEETTIDALRTRALRGEIATLGQSGRRAEQLVLLERLLKVKGVDRRPQIELERAEVLAQLGRAKDAVDAAWRLHLRQPGTKVAAQADALLERLAAKGAAVPEATAKVELARVQALVRQGQTKRAAQALDQLEKKTPELALEIGLERAELLRRDKRRVDEIAALEALQRRVEAEAAGPKPKLDAKRRDALLYEIAERLGKSRLAIDRTDEALAAFATMKALEPRKTRTVEALFLAAWIPYNKGRYAEAAEAFLSFAGEYPRWKRRPEALWFAGWNAYLAGDAGLVRRAFEQLVEQHPGSEMTLFAHYWGGRSKERAGDVAGAQLAYRSVIRIAPLSYQAAWAQHRLEKLGERVVLTAPASSERPATLDEVLVLLGRARPAGIDRAIALQRGGLEEDAMEELDALDGQLARVRDARGRVMIAELLAALGAHHQAFRFANQLVQRGADLLNGEPFAWRAWRLAFPKAFPEEVAVAAEAHGVDPLFILAIMRTESHFRPHVRSPVGARGLMQIMPDTARRIGAVDKAAKGHAARYQQPASNVWLGAWYLRKLLDRYGNQPALAAGAYNAGPGAMDRWLDAGRDVELDAFVERITYRETRLYVRRVLEAYQTYKRLEAQPELDLGWIVSRDVPLRDSTVAF